MTTLNLGARERLNTSRTTSDIPCSVCDQVRHQLRARKSKLLPQQSLYLCNDCATRRYEPRWIIIMAYRRYGLEYVKDYLNPKRYHGDEILLKELT